MYIIVAKILNYQMTPICLCINPFRQYVWFATTRVRIPAWAYLKVVSSWTSLHYLWGSLGPFSLPRAQKWPWNINHHHYHHRLVCTQCLQIELSRSINKSSTRLRRLLFTTGVNSFVLVRDIIELSMPNYLIKLITYPTKILSSNKYVRRENNCRMLRIVLFFN